MITREQVADLQPGVVVELTAAHWPAGSAWRGPLYDDGGDLRVAGALVRFANGAPSGGREWTLTVVSRAPRLYVNHPRKEPAAGDVVRDADSDDASTWMQDADGSWLTIPGGWIPGNGMPSHLRLLVDGETGQAVQS